MRTIDDIHNCISMSLLYTAHGIMNRWTGFFLNARNVMFALSKDPLFYCFFKIKNKINGGGGGGAKMM